MMVVQLSPQGYFAGITEADESPLEPGVMLIPGGCVVAEEPEFNRVTQCARWNGSVWEIEDLPAPAAPPPDPTPEELLAAWRETRVLSRMEFARALMSIGMLTHEQAMEFIRYEPLSEPILALIATLPEEFRADAEFEMQGARDFPRSNAMWDLLCASEGWPEIADVDALFGWVG